MTHFFILKSAASWLGWLWKTVWTEGLSSHESYLRAQELGAMICQRYLPWGQRGTQGSILAGSILPVMLTGTQWGRQEMYCHSHFLEEKNEAQRNKCFIHRVSGKKIRLQMYKLLTQHSFHCLVTPTLWKEVPFHLLSLQENNAGNFHILWKFQSSESPRMLRGVDCTTQMGSSQPVKRIYTEANMTSLCANNT